MERKFETKSEVEGYVVESETPQATAGWITRTRLNASELEIQEDLHGLIYGNIFNEAEDVVKGLGKEAKKVKITLTLKVEEI